MVWEKEYGRKSERERRIGEREEGRKGEREKERKIKRESKANEEIKNDLIRASPPRVSTRLRGLHKLSHQSG